MPFVLWKRSTASGRVEYWSERGNGLAASGHHAEALACYDRVLAIQASIAAIWANRGGALRELDRLDEAEASLREALRLKPDFADAHHELALVLDFLGRFEEAETSARAALRRQPENALAHYRLGNILYRLGRARDAQVSYRTALRLRPDIPRWHGPLGLSLLLAGQLEEGWDEWCWKSGRMVSPFRVPYWNGEALADRAILVFADQSLGDTLQFCRYVPQIAVQAGRTILAVQPSLTRLLSRLPGVTNMTAAGCQPSDFDLCCALMSLPRAAGTKLQTIPAETPYLAAEPADVDQWRGRLAGLTGLRVGLCWAGDRGRNPGKIAWDRRRSISLDLLGSLGGISRVHFISLQKGPPAAETAYPPPGVKLHDFTADLHDFADTAALIENLDLVISVDTSVVHLTGALGKPVWMLNRFDTDWRWLLDREDSPWYPSLRQFRQPTPGDWHSVIQRTRDALKGLAAGDQGQLRPPTPGDVGRA